MGSPTKIMEIDEIRREAEAFWKEKTWEEYQGKIGAKKADDLPRIYEKYRGLFSRKLIMDLKKREGQKDVNPEERRSLKKIISFLISERENLKRIPYELSIDDMEVERKIRIDDEFIDFRSSIVSVANEGERNKRDEIERRRLEFIESINPVLIKMWEVSWDCCKELGFNNYINAWETIKERNFSLLRKAISRILQSTEDIYRDILSWLIKRKIGIRDAEKHDIVFIFRMKEFDRYFPSERLMEVMERSLGELGWSSGGSSGLFIDIDKKSGKVTRAFCSPVSVPDRIFVVIYPLGGQDDYQSLLHELGHAFLYSSKKGDLPFEERYLIEPYFSESIAFVFHYLPLKRAWLRRYLDFSSTENYLLYGYFQKLYMVRRYCAKFLFESMIHEKMDCKEMGGIYSDIMYKGTYVRHPEGYFLYDMDPFIMSAEYLMGWIVASQIESYMRNKFDEDWYRNPRTGPFIREIFSAEELYASKILGIKPYEPQELIEEFNENLR